MKALLTYLLLIFFCSQAQALQDPTYPRPVSTNPLLLQGIFINSASPTASYVLVNHRFYGLYQNIRGYWITAINPYSITLTAQKKHSSALTKEIFL